MCSSLGCLQLIPVSLFKYTVSIQNFIYRPFICVNLKTGKYREALGKWETALTLVPDRAELHEQKAQVLLEIGEAWNALKAATRMSCFHLTFFIFNNLVI